MPPEALRKREAFNEGDASAIVENDCPPEALRKREAFNEGDASAIVENDCPPEALRKREAFNGRSRGWCSGGRAA